MILFLLSNVRLKRERRRRSASTGGDGGHGVEPRFLGSDKPEGGPIELAVTARDSRDKPVPDHVDRGQRGAYFFCFSKRQAHILKHEGQKKSGPVRLPGNLVAVNLMRAS